ncbi:MAG TPA: iron ABC transporter permease [Synergistales bacterium]|nr:iron ABC transporter permease [Synergistaceae bacterium]HOO87081.1 iron ABC transporter permease [Synergistales bacterium]
MKMFGRREGKLDLNQILMLICLTILIITVAMPMIMIVYNTFFYGFTFDWSMFTNVVMDPSNVDAMWNTIVIAFWVTVVGTIVGVFYAWLIGRTNIPLKGLMKTLFVIPYMFPPFIGAMAWGLLLSPRSGYINKLWMLMMGTREPLMNINSIAGIVFVEVCYYFPFVFLQVVSALERMDPTLEESARISGANQLYVIRKITLPLVVPAVAAGAMLILISSLSHFGVPAMLGFSRGIFTLPTKIYELINRSAGSFEGIRQGAALSILLVVVVVIALWLQRKILKAGHYDIIRGKSMRPMLINLRTSKFPLLGVCLASLFVIVILPLYIIFAVGGLKAYGLPLNLANMTLDNYYHVLFSSRMAQDAIKNSFFLAISSAIIAMFVGTMIAYVVVKVKVKGKSLLEILALLPYSVPGIVLAIGVILMWSGTFYLNLYNTIWIILIAYIARYVAFAMKSSSASLEQVHYSLEEAARSCGATHLESLRDITIALIRPGMIAGFFLIFLPAMRELTTSILLYGPFSRTLGVAIYAINAEGNITQSAALSGIAILIIMLGNLALRFVTKDRRSVS